MIVFSVQNNNVNPYFTARPKILKTPIVIPKSVLRTQIRNGLSCEDISKIYDGRISVDEIMTLARNYGITLDSGCGNAAKETDLLSSIMSKLNINSEDALKYFK